MREQYYLKAIVQNLRLSRKKHRALPRLFSSAHLLSHQTFYSIVLLVSFNYLVDCPVSYSFHKGNISCYCPTCAGGIGKKKLEKSDTGGPPEVLAANPLGLRADNAPEQNGVVWTARYSTLAFGHPFLTTVKLLL